MAAGLPELPEGCGFKRFTFANFDAIDPGIARSFVGQLDEALNGSSISLDASLHGAVCAVPDPADQPELGRGLFRPGTKPHALDTPVNLQMTADDHDADYTRKRNRLPQGPRRGHCRVAVRPPIFKKPGTAPWPVPRSFRIRCSASPILCPIAVTGIHDELQAAGSALVYGSRKDECASAFAPTFALRASAAAMTVMKVLSLPEPGPRSCPGADRRTLPERVPGPPGRAGCCSSGLQ
jgi:hypothetical protein